MKHTFHKMVLPLLLVLLTFSGCDSPKSIPDQELTAIVSDIFLANAYHGKGYITYQMVQDSTDMYTPIFARYGYQPRDFTYTIENLSRRKSIRFSDILDEAIKRLERDGGVFFNRLAMDDSLQKISDARYRLLLRSDTLRRITRLSNEKKPDITVTLPGRGRLQVEFVAQLDTADKNSYLQYVYYTTDGKEHKRELTRRTYSRGQQTRESFQVEIPTGSLRDFNLLLASAGNTSMSTSRSGSVARRKADGSKPIKPVKPTKLSIDSLRIWYYIPAAEALDRATRSTLFHLSVDTLATAHEIYFEKNRGPLRLDTVWVAPSSDSLVRRDWVTR